MESKQVQLYLDREKTIEASPETSANCVILSDGNDLQKVLDNDLTNPTVVHEETSFKVGVGDIDVSGSIVDGEVGRMVIKGQTYQNILPEPSLRNSMTNGKTMQKLNEGYDSVNTVDGVCKSAILSGNTLVNLATHSKRQTINVQNLSELNGRLTWNTTGSWGKVGFTIQGKPNTNYCIKYDDRHETLGFYVRFLDGLSGTTQPTTKLSPTCVKFTTDTTGIFTLTLEQGSATTGSWIQSPMIIEYQEGMENWDIPYFTGMKSVRMPVLTTTGKNLCKYRSNWTYGGLTFTNTENGVTVNGTASTYVDYYVTAKSSLINVETIDELNRLQVGTRLFLSNNLGKNSYISYTLNGETNYAGNVTIQNGMEITGAFVRFQQGDICNNLNLTIQLEIGNEATSYEPYKTNILHTPEDVVLKGIGNLKDTLNCNTGEHVQRIKEVVFNGSSSENWYLSGTLPTDTSFTRFDIDGQFVNGVQVGRDKSLVCDKLPYVFIHGLSGGSTTIAQECVSNHSTDANKINLVIKKERLTEVSVAGLKQWLQSNPITVQYELATPIIKTVDLSSSGNWEKVVYSGASNESWSYRQEYDTTNTYCFKNNRTLTNALLVNHTCPSFSDNLPINGLNVDKHSLHINGQPNVIMKIDKKLINEPTDISLKQYLQQNPITVWYQTTNHKDSTQVKQPIFFKDGHIQLSSGADNSLIPTLDYQAKTSNSYVMDLMKTGTTYTMKASGVSGTATIGNAGAFTLNTNRTFTSPASQSLFDNKLLVIKGSATDLMIIEGDVTSKTIPYFKGIKSAFEDEDKIEVLSQGKNLLDPSKFCGDERWLTLNNDQTISISQTASGAWYRLYKDLKIPTNTYITLEVLEGTYEGGNVGLFRNGEKLKELWWGDEGKKVHTYNQVYDELKIWNIRGNCKVRISITETEADYEPYKSNNTKIPLLSPLRSLPNGVCDELIIDRMKKKATLIQRVGHVVFTSNLSYNTGQDSLKTSLFTSSAIYPQASGVRMCNRFLNDEKSNLMLDSMQAKTESEGLGSWSAKENFNIRILASRLGGVPSTSAMTNWLKENPVTILYHLKTPIVTEIDLENFPFIYKDGHIFLNSEIAPVVEIDYNVNQSQQIQANNETLQRHELDILDLDNLIVSFVNAEYNLRLLKFDMELSMMALAE